MKTRTNAAAPMAATGTRRRRRLAFICREPATDPASHPVQSSRIDDQLFSHGSLKSPASPIFALRNHRRRRSHARTFAAAISAPTINNASISM
jgi:hypothetical protein